MKNLITFKEDNKDIVLDINEIFENTIKSLHFYGHYVKELLEASVVYNIVNQDVDRYGDYFVYKARFFSVKYKAENQAQLIDGIQKMAEFWAYMMLSRRFFLKVLLGGLMCLKLELVGEKGEENTYLFHMILYPLFKKDTNEQYSDEELNEIFGGGFNPEGILTTATLNDINYFKNQSKFTNNEENSFRF